MADPIGALRVLLSAGAAQFANDMKSARGELKGMAAGVKNVAGVFRDLALAAAPVAAVGGAIFGMAKHAANTGEALLKMSQQTGVSVEELSLLKFAAQQSETDIESLATGFKFLGKNMQEAQKPGSEAANAFAAIGVETRKADGTLRPMNEVMGEVADMFRDLPDGATKSALAMKLFGKSGTELIPFLNNGADGIKKFTDRAKDLGLQITTEQAKAADRFNDQFNEMTRSAEGLAIKVGNTLIPAITELMTALTNLGTEGKRSEGLLVFFPWLKEIPAFADKTKDIPRILMEMRTSFGTMATGTAEDQAKMKAALDEALVSYRKAVEAMAQLKLGSEERAKAELKAMAEIDKAQQAQSESFADHAKLQEQATLKSLEDYLELRRIYKQTDEDYFAWYGKMLELQGNSTAMVQAKIAQHVQDLKLTLESDAGKMAELWAAWFGDTTTMLQDFQSFSRDTWHFFSRGFGDAVGAMIVDGQSLGQSLKNLFKQILAAFISMLVQMAAKWAAMKIFTSFAAPGFSSLVPTQGVLPLASGGIVTRPTFALIGEGGPEAVIPLDQMGGMGTINVYIQGKPFMTKSDWDQFTTEQAPSLATLFGNTGGRLPGGVRVQIA